MIRDARERAGRNVAHDVSAARLGEALHEGASVATRTPSISSHSASVERT